MTGPSRSIDSSSASPAGPPVSESGSAQPFPYAGRMRRLVAGVIDFAVSYGITLIIDIPIWGYHRTTTGGKGSAGHQIAIDLIATAIGLAYYSWPHARWGQTLGKRALGIRLRSIDGDAISYRQAIGRYLFQTLFFIAANAAAGIATPLALIGFLNLAWILWNPRRQALHDKAAHTVVVRTRTTAPYSP